MNLLSVLFKALLSKEAIKALAEKTGLDGKSLTMNNYLEGGVTQ